MKQLAAQTYTVRDHLEKPADIAASLKKIRRIGYEAVQLSGLGPIDDSELAKMLRGEGLVCCATHENGEMILNEPDKIAAKLDKLDCRYTAYPCPPAEYMASIDSVRTLAKRLDAAGGALRKAHKVLGYHNHHLEFVRIGGELILDLIYDNTDPANLVGEIDTYWVQYGGGDPVGWCAKLRGRLPLLHVKDYKVKDGTPTYAEIGRGNLNWPAIVSEAEKSGCEWFIVEQDTCDGDPFDALKASLEYMKEKLCT
jgi:sugar phosphate isomerase/epimerase